MARKITEKQRTFTLRVFEAKEDPGPIYFSIYKCKSMAVASACASRLLTNAKVAEFLQELQQQAQDDSVASVLERKQVLTEIIRGRFADFMTNLTPEKLKSAALQEIKILENVGPAGGKTTTIKINDHTKAIDLLNKMEKLYGDGVNLNVDARSIHIGDEDDDPKGALISLLNGIAARAGEGEMAQEPDGSASGEDKD
ncbi:hypothetical protein LCGC14_1499390 [marine sediment metagenome]|uniref:Terminase small subunit n=1 Tax=marine sediment metagenome TaxID=412755 RepID=A0A0F9J514_9ZZZZ